MTPRLQITAKPCARFYLGRCEDLLTNMCGGLGKHKFRLAIADPPYNIKAKYDGSFSDNQPWRDYLDWTHRWLRAVWFRVAVNGSLWVVVPPRIAARVRVFAEDELGAFCQNEIVWAYRFGQHTSHRFISAHTTLLWFTRYRTGFVWNPDAVLCPSDRLAKYNDTRTADSPRGGYRVPLDVWHYARVQGNNLERRPGHPNQLPEHLVARIVRACSAAGDWVLDPFVGSGTTTTVARGLRRRTVGIDVSMQYLYSAFLRTKRGPVRDVTKEHGVTKP